MTLKLVLKKCWYDMIQSGKKTEEYREVTDYWISRLCKRPFIIHSGKFKFKEFTSVRFYLGYSKDRRQMEFQCKEITEGFGKPEWGGGRQNYFIIKLGNRIS